MSDERWNPENQGKQFSDDSNIVDSTAEVVDEAEAELHPEDIQTVTGRIPTPLPGTGRTIQIQQYTGRIRKPEASTKPIRRAPLRAAPIPMRIMVLQQETEVTVMRVPAMSTIRAIITAPL